MLYIGYIRNDSIYLGANSLTIGSAGILVLALVVLLTTISLIGKLLLETIAKSFLRMSYILLLNLGLVTISIG